MPHAEIKAKNHGSQDLGKEGNYISMITLMVFMMMMMGKNLDSMVAALHTWSQQDPLIGAQTHTSVEVNSRLHRAEAFGTKTGLPQEIHHRTFCP